MSNTLIYQEYSGFREVFYSGLLSAPIGRVSQLAYDGRSESLLKPTKKFL